MMWLKVNWKRVLIGFIVLLTLAAVYIFFPIREDLSSLKDLAKNYNVKMLRDTYGVPHIFGHTDADAAYGLAYAHSEDDFLTIQQVLLAARGKLATVYGADSAPADYLVQFLRVWDVVDAEYEKLSPGTRKIVEAYADGLNVYAAHHPDEVLLVIWDKDGNVHSMSVHQFGSNTLHEDSPHYADQAPLLANRQLKPVWFDEEEIRQHLEREYVPGEE